MNESFVCDYVGFHNARNLSEYEQIINGKQGFIIWGIIFVVVTFLGSIGNILTIIVLRHDQVMSTLTILLIALAISDMLAPLANALLALSHYHLSERYQNSILFLQFHDILRYIIHPLSSMFTMSSSWIIATTTLFRLIVVMSPLKARTLINKNVAVISLMIIFGVSLAFIIPIYTNLITRTKCTNNRIQYTGLDIEVSSVIMKNAYIPMMQVMCFYLPWLTALGFW
jgi:hypothetical protein